MNANLINFLENISHHSSVSVSSTPVVQSELESIADICICSESLAPAREQKLCCEGSDCRRRDIVRVAIGIVSSLYSQACRAYSLKHFSVLNRYTVRLILAHVLRVCFYRRNM